MDVRRVGAPYAPHFAWFLHGFCMNIETCHFDMLVFARFCTVFACGTACFFHTWNILHDMWNSLHVFLHDTNSFFPEALRRVLLLKAAANFTCQLLMPTCRELLHLPTSHANLSRVTSPANFSCQLVESYFTFLLLMSTF